MFVRTACSCCDVAALLCLHLCLAARPFSVSTAALLCSKYKYFFFINSSVKGPFYPSYMPYGWHWTHAFLERFAPGSLSAQEDASAAAGSVAGDRAGTGRRTHAHAPAGAFAPAVHAVGSGLVCLPHTDAGMV